MSSDGIYNYMNKEKNVSKKNKLTFSTIVFDIKDRGIEANNNEQYIGNNGQNINVHQSINKLSVNKLTKICRICYMEEDSDIKNPLVQPCKCSGSMKYIHLNCLKQWLYTKSCTRLEKKKKFFYIHYKASRMRIMQNKITRFYNT
jgi:hypothetical protein